MLKLRLISFLNDDDQGRVYANESFKNDWLLENEVEQLIFHKQIAKYQAALKINAKTPISCIYHKVLGRQLRTLQMKQRLLGPNRHVQHRYYRHSTDTTRAVQILHS